MKAFINTLLLCSTLNPLWSSSDDPQQELISRTPTIHYNLSDPSDDESDSERPQGEGSLEQLEMQDTPPHNSPEPINFYPEEFKGNWTGLFVAGPQKLEILHTPKAVQVGNFVSNVYIKLDAQSISGIPLLNPLMLKTDSTIEEFVHSMQYAGIGHWRYFVPSQDSTKSTEK